MKLSQAVKYHGSVHIEGWDGTQWVPLLLYGDLLSYDRFIGPRTFGHKQRVFLLGGDDMIGSSIDFIRFPNGKQYLILSYNQDLQGGDLIGTAYIVQEAPFDLEVLTYTTTPAPSGLPADETETVTATSFCDLERYSSSSSSEFDSVRYASYSIVVPRGLAVGLDNDVRVNNEVYEIQEVNPMLNQTELRTVKRGQT